MEAVIFTAKETKLEFNRVQIPKIHQPDQVLIKVAYSGICGSDLHIIQGHFPCNEKEPFSLGHEFSGTVEDVGAQVTIYKKGDRVCVDPNSGCSCCDVCHSGKPHFCSKGGLNNTIGIYRNGGWAEYVLAPVTQVLKLPDGITLEQGLNNSIGVHQNGGWAEYVLAPVTQVLKLPDGITLEQGLNNSIGVHQNGGWAEYVLAPVTQVLKLPDGITLEQAALAEPLSCVAHGWDIISPVTVGMKILITGAGIIGNLWVSVLHLQGHRNVTVSEPNTSRLHHLKRLNTGFKLITPDELKKNQQQDPNYLFDLVIDCSGYPPAIEHAVSLLQMGGKLCCFGVAPPDGEIKIKPYDLFWKELKIFGVVINPFSFPKSFGLLEAMGDRYLNYEALGVKTFQLKDYKEAIQSLKQGAISKAVFKM